MKLVLVVALSMLVLPCYGQQKAAKKASAPVVESAEHRHARLALAEAQADVDEKQKITDAKDSRSNQLEWITINCYDRIPGGIAKPGISIQASRGAVGAAVFRGCCEFTGRFANALRALCALVRGILAAASRPISCPTLE